MLTRRTLHRLHAQTSPQLVFSTDHTLPLAHTCTQSQSQGAAEATRVQGGAGGCARVLSRGARRPCGRRCTSMPAGRRRPGQVRDAGAGGGDVEDRLGQFAERRELSEGERQQWGWLSAGICRSDFAGAGARMRAKYRPPTTGTRTETTARPCRHSARRRHCAALCASGPRCRGQKVEVSRLKFII